MFIIYHVLGIVLNSEDNSEDIAINKIVEKVPYFLKLIF